MRVSAFTFSARIQQKFHAMEVVFTIVPLIHARKNNDGNFKLILSIDIGSMRNQRVHDFGGFFALGQGMSILIASKYYL